MSRTTQAWDLYDIYVDLEDALAEKVRERCADPSLYDEDGKLVYIRRSTLLWEVLQEYFVREFDMHGTMAALCDSYGIDNLYE